MKNNLFKSAKFLILVIFGFCCWICSYYLLKKNDIVTSPEIASSSRVLVKDYSKKLLDKSIEDGKVVIIILRSEYSIWSPSILDSENVYKLQSDGRIELLDLKWSWEGPSTDEKFFFEKFGFSKEAFIVIYYNGKVKKLDNVEQIESFVANII